MDPAATKILKRMTDYLGSLKQFSVRTQNTFEDVLDSGHRVDFDVSATVIVSRPNKIRAERKGELVDQVFYYDGKTVTLYNPTDKVYATVPAPGTFEGMFKFMYESLGIFIPVSDLVYRQRLPAIDAGCDLGEGGRQGVYRRGQVRSFALQPPGCRLSGMGRGQRPAVAAQVCRHRHEEPLSC